MRLLEQYDVDTVFGIPGVHTLEIYRGLAASDINHVSPRHEQGAAFMADGYARVAGKPGVCVLITGAGLTNAATPVAGAYHDSIPMLVVSSATASRDNGARARLAARPARPACIHGDDHGRLDRRPRSGRAARGIRTGVRDLRVAAPATRAHRHPDRRARSARAVVRAPGDAGHAPVADAALVERAVELLAGAERPMLLLGGARPGRAPKQPPWPSAWALPSA